MNVLSLFDGISCGRVALDRAGISVKNYYASEIDKFAIKVSQKNYSDIVRLGDVTEWRTWSIDWASIDLLIGGSPCQGLSFAGKRLKLDDPRSKLFFEYLDILKHIQKVNPSVKFLLENVNTDKITLNTISDLLCVDPVCINSSLVSAQNRVRNYWSNLQIEQPNDRHIYLKDIINNDFDQADICSDGWHKWWDENHEFQKAKKYSQDCTDKDKAITLTARMYASWNGNFIKVTSAQIGIVQRGRGKNKGGFHAEKSPTVTSHSWQHNHRLVVENDREWWYRKLSPVECERLQTLPDNYTDCVAKSQRYKQLGNGWTVDVVAHILSGLKKIEDTQMIKILNINCMDHMRSLPDNFYDLAICDPPYFKGVGKLGFYGSKVSNTGVIRQDFEIDHEIWDNNIPSFEYLSELKRVSKNQIIWGINYFDFQGDCGSGRIIWDKKNDHTDFSHCEIASCSFIDSVKIFRWRWAGMIQEKMKNKQVKIHPTQKPIELYEWLLSQYAKPGDKILDTHLGSGSSAIAAANFGFEFVGCELDSKMAAKARERLDKHLNQGRLAI